MIDKDYAASLLASGLKADLLLIATSVERVALDYNKPSQRWLETITVSEAKSYLSEGYFPEGSMGPKMQAVIWFLEDGGREALITNPENLERALAGETGTRIMQVKAKAHSSFRNMHLNSHDILTFNQGVARSSPA